MYELTTNVYNVKNVFIIIITFFLSMGVGQSATKSAPPPSVDGGDRKTAACDECGAPIAGDVGPSSTLADRQHQTYRVEVGPADEIRRVCRACFEAMTAS